MTDGVAAAAADDNAAFAVFEHVGCDVPARHVVVQIDCVDAGRLDLWGYCVSHVREDGVHDGVAAVNERRPTLSARVKPTHVGRFVCAVSERISFEHAVAARVHVAPARTMSDMRSISVYSTFDVLFDITSRCVFSMMSAASACDTKKWGSGHRPRTRMNRHHS